MAVLVEVDLEAEVPEEGGEVEFCPSTMTPDLETGALNSEVRTHYGKSAIFRANKPPMDRLKALLEFYREDAHDPFTRFAIAQEHLKLGNASEAVAFFEGLVNDHPTYVGTYYHLGKLYDQLGREGDAHATFRAGIDIATAQNDTHARAELQSALLESEGLGFDD